MRPLRFLKSPNLLELISDHFAWRYSNTARFRKLMPADKARSKALSILEEFQSHPANHHEFFKYLEELSKEGMTPEQFLVYRDNFFYRTANTILSVATHATKAVYNHDYKALANVTKNFSDEGGHGILEGVHLKLLEDSHNFHGKIVFGVPGITIPDSKNSPFLIEEVLQFRKNQERLFRSSYPTFAGCLLAHEDAADQMLVNFRKFIFDPYRGYYTKEAFKNLIEYYTVHRDETKEDGNVEERHKEEALMIASDMIATIPRSEKLILEGGKKFLGAQSNLWSGLMREIENSKFHGPIATPEYEFLENEREQKTSIKSPSAAQLLNIQKNTPTI